MEDCEVMERSRWQTGFFMTAAQDIQERMTGSRSLEMWCLIAFAILSPGSVFADTTTEQTAQAGRFFGEYCTQCHGATKSKGKVTLHDFSFEQGSVEKLKLWERVLEAVEGGDMPPEDAKKQPTAAARKEIAAIFAAELHRQTPQLAGTEPRAAVARRLTNFEYENTMRDLLGVELRHKASLPEDPVKPYHFNNAAEFMLVGPEQIERYLECAKRALASVIVEPALPEVRRERREWKPEGAHRGMGFDEVGIWGNRRGSASQGIAIENPPRTGEFRIRFKASAILPAGVNEVPLRLVMGYDLNTNSSTLRVEPVGTVRLKNSPDEPEVFEMRGRIENFPVQPEVPAKGKRVPERLHITPQILHDDGTLNDENNFQKPRREAMPRAVIEWMEFEGPLTATWPPEPHMRILFDSPLRKADPKAYVRAVLERFLARAFRRPATVEEVARFTAIHELVRPTCATFEQAMRETLALVLISPQFLYHTVADGAVVTPQFELASRLSYFLWGSMPDAELLRLAVEGKLAEARVIGQQVLRLLADKRSADFVANFTMQWLSLAKMKTVPINRELFPRFLYYVPLGERAGTEEPYRPTVRDYLLDETIAFVGELIRRNASVLNVVDSDFAMLNQRLAAHYGVAGVQGDELRAVPLKPEHQLGGLLTQGSVLIGNGTGTAPHPIYRAVWLREAILGEKVPAPPAEVPALSDTAGASAEKAHSIKDLLVKHRQVEACNHCHARLDPWGVPFEHYNAVGQYQPLVPRDGTRVRPFEPQGDKTLDGYRAYLQTVNTVSVEADSILPKGPKVDGMRQLKAFLLRERADDVVKNVIRRLTTYGIGRELGVRDRTALDALLANTKAKKFGMRDMIVAICQSELFTAASTSKNPPANSTR